MTYQDCGTMVWFCFEPGDYVQTLDVLLLDTHILKAS